MGEFVAATALRVDDLDAALEAVIRYGESHGVPAEPISYADADPKTAVDIWPSMDGWTVMIWPKWFTGLEMAARWLSREFDTLVSAIDVYDGDFWNHLLWRGGAELDRFSSWPNYFTKDRRETKRLLQEWAGHPDVIAEAFGGPVDRIAPYLIPPHSSGLFGRMLRGRKPFPDDATELEDIWIFVDFWRRLGITFPDDTPAARSVLFHDPGPSGLPGGGPSL